jgi:tRNA A37 threonylcarbamoyladenosine biosynthesis protein TsaE
LEGQHQIMAAGLDEYFSPAGVAVVEWIERWQGPEPACCLRFSLEIIDETERRISYE